MVKPASVRADVPSARKDYQHLQCERRIWKFNAPWPPLILEGELIAGQAAPFGRMCHPPALTISICNATGGL